MKSLQMKEKGITDQSGKILQGFLITEKGEGKLKSLVIVNSGIQEKVRELSLEDNSDIYKGSKAIYNHAFNPETTPKTGDMEELDFINDQNTTHYKKSKLEGLATLAEVLRDDVTATYIDKFRKMFNPFVEPVRHAIYVSEEEEEEDIEV